jgi:hypothetical protein
MCMAFCIQRSIALASPAISPSNFLAYRLRKRYGDFQAFVDAGQRLGDLHCGFDSVEPYLVTIEGAAAR